MLFQDMIRQDIEEGGFRGLPCLSFFKGLVVCNPAYLCNFLECFKNKKLILFLNQWIIEATNATKKNGHFLWAF